MKLRMPIAVAALCAALALPGAAEAKAPPKGQYKCTTGGKSSGKLRIRSAGSYTRRGKKGKFAARGGKQEYDDGARGWDIKFRTGSFRGLKGRWYKTRNGGIQIALDDPLNKGESVYCFRRK
jgi:hypothetical protein